MNIHRIYGAISPWFRKSRMERFRTLVRPFAGERLLDVGGTPHFWEQTGGSVPQITLLNLPGKGQTTRATSHAGVEGDGCALPFPDQSFEIIFSNSVIEHVGTWERQEAFAQEARRVGQRPWVQTPAREFPIEPHVIAPFFHWLPRHWQRRLMRNFTLRGWLERPDEATVEAFLKEVRLISHEEMKRLFPDCVILRERFLGLTKSYIAVRLKP